VASAEQIVRQHVFDPDAVEFESAPVTDRIEVVDFDPRWAVEFAELAGLIRGALGADVLDLEHVGSTAVPGLSAKPVIDIDLTVADSSDEAAYRPRLERAGFRFELRERPWHEHRMLTFDRPRANLHVWSPNCPEVIRHRLFRDWLIAHPNDRELYANAKLAARDAVNVDAEVFMRSYTEHKQPVIEQILNRMFRAQGLLS